MLCIKDASASASASVQVALPGGLKSLRGVGGQLSATVRRPRGLSVWHTASGPGLSWEGPRSCTGCHTRPFCNSPDGRAATGHGWKELLAPVHPSTRDQTARTPAVGASWHRGTRAIPGIQALPTAFRTQWRSQGRPPLGPCHHGTSVGGWHALGRSAELLLHHLNPGLRVSRAKMHRPPPTPKLRACCRDRGSNAVWSAQWAWRRGGQAGPRREVCLRGLVDRDSRSKGKGAGTSSRRPCPLRRVNLLLKVLQIL